VRLGKKVDVVVGSGLGGTSLIGAASVTLDTELA
jgi:hypothetical protein